MTWSSTTIDRARAFGALLVAHAGALVCLGDAGCAPRPRMCTASADCAGPAACVAGRCQPDRPQVKPAIDASRRLKVRPVDLAFLSRGGGGSGLPPSFALGRDSAVLLLRFSVTLPATANVVEAYVVLRRADTVDDDPAPVSLHATRIVDPWDGRSTSFARQPRLADVRAPATVVEPGGPSLVRLDVLDIVKQWPRHDVGDHGIGVVAEADAGTGATFAFRASGEAQSDLEPYLEVYLR